MFQIQICLLNADICNLFKIYLQIDISVHFVFLIQISSLIKKYIYYL